MSPFSEIKNVDELIVNIDNRQLFRSDYYTPRIPLLIKGGAKDWPIMQKWSKEYFIDRGGNYECSIVRDSRPAFSKEKSTLKEYFKNHEGKSILTLRDFDKKNIPFFLKDVTIPNPLFSRSDIYRFFLFHAHQDEGTLPHNHGDAFNILQSGTKHWIFYDANQQVSPEGRKVMMETMKKYPPGSHAKDYYASEVSAISSQLTNVTQCIQEAGDIVYVPRQYCHSVLNLSEVLGVVFETKILTR